MDRFGEKVVCNPTTKLTKEKKCGFISMEMIKPGYKHVSGEAEVFNGQSGAKFSDGDVLMARITPCLENGKISRAKLPDDCKSGYGSTEFFVFRGMKGVTDTDYIYYLLNTDYMKQMAVNSMTGASGRQRADIGFIKRIKWPFPSYDKQIEISKVLNVYDDLIEKNLERIALLEHASEEIFREWFIRFRFPGHEREHFHDGIPTSWCIQRIEDFGRIETGKTPSMEIEQYYGDEIMFIKTPDMHGNTFVLNTEEMLSQLGSDSQPKKLLPARSIMVTYIGTGGVVAINADRAHTNQQINSIVLKDDRYLEWLFFSCKRLKPTIELFGATGTTMTNLSKGKFSRLKIITPSEDLIIRFHEEVNDILGRILILQKENQELIRQRDRLAKHLIYKDIVFEE